VVDEDFNLDFFNRLSTQMIQQKKLILKCYQVNPKNTQKHQGLFQRWKRHESMFATIGFFDPWNPKHPKIIIETNLFCIRHIYKPKEMLFIILNTLENLIFVNKNWSSDSRVGYKSPSNLVELIEKYLFFFQKVQKNKKFIWTKWNYGHIKCWKGKKKITF